MPADEQPDELKTVKLQVVRLSMQVFALRSAVGELVAAIALQSNDPDKTFERLVAALSGIADSLAQNVSDPLPQDAEFTRAMEQMRTLAEGAFRRRLSRDG